jgi:CRISPR system Cascade subunit CasD
VTGLLLRLAGPLQSWGERSVFDTRDTAAIPTRSGLIGLISASLGYPRGASLDRLRPLRFTIRIDRPGVRIVDYQTVGGGLPPHQKIPTADGKGRPADKGTIQTWREYLSDAVFVVAVQGPATVLDEVAHALRHPHWQPYLGRRNCPPTHPFLLADTAADPMAELCERVPLAVNHHNVSDSEGVAVEFVNDTGSSDAVRSEMRDDPTRFDLFDRHYGIRPIWISTRTLPETLRHHSSRDYQRALETYVAQRSR